MFELDKISVHAIVAKMIISEELMASMDEPTECKNFIINFLTKKIPPKCLYTFNVFLRYGDASNGTFQATILIFAII